MRAIKSQATALFSLSNRLLYAGRFKEGLVAVQEAADLYRIIAAEQPAALNDDLDRGLQNLSNHLSSLMDQWKEALTGTEKWRVSVGLLA